MSNIEANSIFDGLSHDSKKLILNKINKVVLKKKDYVWKIGDPGLNIILIQKGLIELISRDKFDNDVYLALFGPSDAMGMPALYLNTNYQYDCRAVISDTIAYQLPIRSVLSNCNNLKIVNEIDIWIRDCLLAHYKVITNRIYILSAKIVDFKLLYLIDNLCSRFGVQTNKKGVICIPISIPKVAFARHTDSRLETVVRVFSKWQKNNLINWDSDKGILIDLEKISRQIESENQNNF